MAAARTVVSFVGALAMTLVSVSCAESSNSQCVRSGEAKVCWVEQSGGGFLEVSGLQPGSTLTLSGPDGETTSQINDSGALEGKLGVLNGLGASFRISVFAMTAEGRPLAGTFDS